MPIFERKENVITSESASNVRNAGTASENKSGITVNVEWNLPFKKKNSSQCNASLKPLTNWARRQRMICLIPVALSALAQVFLLTQVENLTNMAMAGNPNAASASLAAALPALLITVPLILLESLTHSKYEKNVSIRLRKFVINRMTVLTPYQFERINSSHYITGMTRYASQAVNDFFLGKLDLLSGAIDLAVGIVLALTVNWVLLLLSAFLFLIIYVFAQTFIGKQEKVFEENLKSEEDYTARVREALSGYQLIQQNNLHSYILTSLDSSANAALLAKRNFKKMVYKAGQYISLTGSLAIYLFFLIIAQEAGRTGASYGKILFMLSAFLFILQPAMSMISNLPSLKNGEEALEKLLQLTEPTLETGSKEINEIHHGIRFERVSFAYDGHPVLNHVSFDIRKGEKILLIGPSGSGKTTLLKLIQKYLTPTDGFITVDEINLSDISGDSWAGLFTCLTQQVFLPDDTLKNNITLRLNAEQDRLDEVIDVSGLRHLVSEIPGGLDARIGFMGKNLSGGEKKRIGIARAIFRNAPLLLLDEPFSGLDRETAIDIEKSVLSLRETTVINVSHVMFDETIPLYDRIIRVADGRVEDATVLYQGK